MDSYRGTGFLGEMLMNRPDPNPNPSLQSDYVLFGVAELWPERHHPQVGTDGVPQLRGRDTRLGVCD